MNKIEELLNEVITLSDYKRDNTDGCSKIFEPSISIYLNKQKEWSAEIYSYILNFEDYSRHHYFTGKTYEELIENIEKAIEKEKKQVVEDVKQYKAYVEDQ